MSHTLKTPRGTYYTLVAGFALGAVCMASVFNGQTVTRAVADQNRALHQASLATGEDMAALRGLDASFANLAEFVSPAVVHIRAQSTRAAGPNGERVPVQGGEGSGFIFRPDGYIITNDHVVGGFERVTVILRNGREYPGTVTRAQDSDIAVVKIEATGLPTLQFADSSKVRPGQFAMAVGAPFGLENSVTMGHVSALGRTNAIPDRNGEDRFYDDLIQTDTSINMGNSGGPLVNIDGQVIGINTSIFSPTGVNAGIGFAIPSNQARFIADMLIRDGKITRSMMGLYPENLKEYEKEEMGLEGGARVHEVSSDGPAAAAGIQKEDVIVKIGSTPIRSHVDLRSSMLVYRPGETVPVELVRNGQRRTVQVKLEEFKRPARPTPPRGQMPPDFDPFRDFAPFREMPEIRPPRGGGEEELVPPIRDGQARLGVSVATVNEELRGQFEIPANVRGAVVAAVEPGSVAARLGLAPGDVIQQIGSTQIDTAEALTEAMKGLKWGDRTRIMFSRFGAGSVARQTMDVVFR
jgi:serine protease Do